MSSTHIHAHTGMIPAQAKVLQSAGEAGEHALEVPALEKVKRGTRKFRLLPETVSKEENF